MCIVFIRLLLGVMFVTGFLSLWIQNTAAASMMLPIVVALVKQIAKYNPAYNTEDGHHHHHHHHHKKPSNKVRGKKDISYCNIYILSNNQY